MTVEERVRKLEKKSNGWLVGKVAKLEKRITELQKDLETVIHRLHVHPEPCHYTDYQSYYDNNPNLKVVFPDIDGDYVPPEDSGGGTT